MLKISILMLLIVCGAVSLSASHYEKEDPKDRHKTLTKETFPTEMEHNYDELLTTWKNSLPYSNDCVSNDDSFISAVDSVYIRRLYSLPTEMELVFNSIVRNYIEMYAGRRREQVSYMLGEGAYYFPMFENILDKENMPLELKYLPVIESALNPIARSRMGATGLWQFMASTGRMYKLEVNSLVDERRDPLKSTEAAAKYLKDLYSIYGDWNLVIAAYNCGPGNVNKAIRRSGGERDYWAIYPYLPKETRGYVPAFIAATYIMNYYEEHNICPAQSTQLTSLDTLFIDKNIHFEQISGVLNIDVKDIRKFNPQFKNDIIPGSYKYYALNLPFNDVSAFIANKDSILAFKNNELLTHRKIVDMGLAQSAAGSSIVHRVKSGDILSHIANRYGVTVSQLKSWNNLRSDKLTIGRRISINKGGSSVKLSSKKGKSEQVVTQTNETNTNNILSKPELMIISIDANNTANLISHYIGSIERDKPSLPLMSIGSLNSKERTTYDDSKILYHKVRDGETIMQIAELYKVSQNEILGWNNLPNHLTEVGQRLLIHLPESKTTKVAQANNRTEGSATIVY